MKDNKLAGALKETGTKKIADVAKDFSPVTPQTWGGGVDTPVSEKKVHKDYPHFNLRIKDIPEAKDWEVGKIYSISLIVEQTSRRQDDYSDDVGFDILGIKAGGEIDKADLPEGIEVEDSEDDDDEEDGDDAPSY